MKNFILFLSCIFLLQTAYSQEIDEVIIQPNNGASNDNFGTDVDIDGDLMVVGAHKKNAGGLPDAGEVYVYRRVSGQWTLEQNLIADDAAISDQFGTSVSIFGDKIAVGSPNNSEAAFNGGAVYIYKFDNGTWVEEEKILAGDANDSDNFGFSVSLDNDRVLIGCPNNNGGSPNIGGAYVYDFDGNNWIFTQKLVSTFSEFGGESLGYDVALEGDVAVLGSPLDDDAGTDSGTGFIYRFNGTNWIFEQKLVASDGGNSHSFSFSVDIDGIKVIVGAYGSGNSSSGACYIFEYDGTNWIEEHLFYGASPSSDDWLGYDVAINGETFLASAINDDGKASNGGATHVYRWDVVESEWILELTLYPTDGGNGDDYGSSVAIDQFDIVVGSPFRDLSGSNSGLAYYYDLCTYTPKQEICIATVDSSSVGHYILFEKDRATMIDSFYLWRLDDNFQLSKIDSSSYFDDEEFYYIPDDIDFDSVTYFITTRNICGNLSEMGDTTRTFTVFAEYINNGAEVELNWTHYLGYDFDYYRIFRDDDGTGNFVQIGAMLGQVTTFTDNNPPSNNTTFYRIDAWDGPECDLSRGYEYAMTNAYNPLYASTHEYFNGDKIKIYPKPANELVNITYEGGKIDFQITDLSGKVLNNGQLNNKTQVNVQEWSTGMYIVKFIKSGTVIHHEKIIVNR